MKKKHSADPPSDYRRSRLSVFPSEATPSLGRLANTNRASVAPNSHGWSMALPAPLSLLAALTLSKVNTITCSLGLCFTATWQLCLLSNKSLSGAGRVSTVHVCPVCVCVCVSTCAASGNLPRPQRLSQSLPMTFRSRASLNPTTTA